MRLENEKVESRDLDQSAFGFMKQIPEVGPPLNVGIVGASGIVGRTLIRILRQRGFPVGELHLYSSDSSAGKWIESPFGQLYFESLNIRKPPHHDLVFMAAGHEVAKTWGWRFARRGAVVIDKSSYFRNKSYAPLVVPEVNPAALKIHKGIIANPNCTTIPFVTALKPLHDRWRLKSATIVSFQSVSGAGRDGVVALSEELEDSEKTATAFPHRIADNVIPWIGSSGESFSLEERKMISESRKILDLPRLPIRVTSVRVPVFVGHSLAVHATFRSKVSVESAREALTGSDGIKLIDNPLEDEYPTPLNAVGIDDILVGRLRIDRGRHGLALWISVDNLRKGAATNAVQIAEELFIKQSNNSKS